MTLLRAVICRGFILDLWSASRVVLVETLSPTCGRRRGAVSVRLHSRTLVGASFCVGGDRTPTFGRRLCAVSFSTSGRCLFVLSFVAHDREDVHLDTVFLHD